MLEIPETVTLARQLNAAVQGRRIEAVLPPSKAHKFCWYCGDPAEYDRRMVGHTVTGAVGFGMFCELSLDGGEGLCVNDGVNVRLVKDADVPPAYQLAVCLDGGETLVFTVAMYGGIILHDCAYDNDYYLRSRAAVSPLAPGFAAVYRDAWNAAKPTLSAKAFLATEQRFPGLGNGVLQDILFTARLHPKRKIRTLSDGDRARLLVCIQTVLADMIARGGRDTEKDLFGVSGGYRTLMSKNTLDSGCPVCGGAIVKEAYLGGSVYYCPNCQPLV